MVGSSGGSGVVQGTGVCPSKICHLSVDVAVITGVPVSLGVGIENVFEATGAAELATVVVEVMAVDWQAETINTGREISRNTFFIHKTLNHAKIFQVEKIMVIAHKHRLVTPEKRASHEIY